MGQLRLLVWIGLGARREAVARAASQMIELRGLIKTALNDSDLSNAHGFLSHFQTQIEDIFKMREWVPHIFRSKS